MKPEQPIRSPSHLFTVRVWLEPLGQDQTEWRGKIEQVLTGEWHYFRDWPTLIAFLETMLPANKTTE
jgi:hypothetical protein